MATGTDATGDLAGEIRQAVRDFSPALADDTAIPVLRPSLRSWPNGTPTRSFNASGYGPRRAREPGIDADQLAVVFRRTSMGTVSTFGLCGEHGLSIQR